MTFPPPTAEQILSSRRRAASIDARIAAVKLEIARREKAAKLSTVTSLLPKPVKHWLQQNVGWPSQGAGSVQEAQVEHDWLVYDRKNPKRPLYPRERAISPSNKSFNRELQTCHSQEQSWLFKFPPEIRAEIFRAVMGKLVIEVEAMRVGSGGPKGSEDRTVFWHSKIEDARSGGSWFSRGHHLKSTHTRPGYTPAIIPLLQSCRRVYAEAIEILYTENAFKNHGHHNSVDWTKYLLDQRLQSIRTYHYQLNLGYRWDAPCVRFALEAIASLKSLQMLCIIGFADRMVDSTREEFLSEEHWKERKHLLLPLIGKLGFVKEVDVFLPIMHSVLVKEGEETIEGCRVHGLTVEQTTGKERAVCACEYRPEELVVPPSNGEQERRLREEE